MLNGLSRQGRPFMILLLLALGVSACGAQPTEPASEAATEAPADAATEQVPPEATEAMGANGEAAAPAGAWPCPNSGGGTKAGDRSGSAGQPVR